MASGGRREREKKTLRNGNLRRGVYSGVMAKEMGGGLGKDPWCSFNEAGRTLAKSATELQTKKRQHVARTGNSFNR